MAIVTTYVCDVSGKSSSDKTQFVEIKIDAAGFEIGQYVGATPHKRSGSNAVKVEKFVHVDIAKKLNLLPVIKDEPEQPEVSFEGKLKALLTEFIDEIVEESVSNAMSHRNG